MLSGLTPLYFKAIYIYYFYKKLVNNDTTQPEELQNFVLDSKYKCKEILEKLVDSDDEDVFDTDDEQDSEQEQDLENPARKYSDDKKYDENYDDYDYEN